MAEADLLEIGGYSLEQWGQSQADAYLDELKACLRILSAHPKLGRQCDVIRPGLRRFEKADHVIFFRESRQGISVARVLHAKMLPDLRDF